MRLLLPALSALYRRFRRSRSGYVRVLTVPIKHELVLTVNRYTGSLLVSMQHRLNVNLREAFRAWDIFGAEEWRRSW